MFLIPDKNNWLDPKTGEPVELRGKTFDPNFEAVEMSEEGMLTAHPVPDSMRTSRGAKRGQLTGHDYRVLQERGVSVEEIQQSNDMYLLKKMREES
jgi:hypothetical protein